MVEVRGQAPIIGYTSSIDELKIDLEMYHLFYAACGNGTTMTPEQLVRYDDLRKIFE